MPIGISPDIGETFINGSVNAAIPCEVVTKNSRLSTGLDLIKKN